MRLPIKTDVLNLLIDFRYVPIAASRATLHADIFRDPSQFLRAYRSALSLASHTVLSNQARECADHFVG